MTIRDYIEQITDVKLKGKLFLLYDDYETFFKSNPAAIKYHHTESGGLYRHTLQVIENALELYKIFEVQLRKYAVSRNDVILVALIHDLEKVKKYLPNKKYVNKNVTFNETEFVFNYNKVDTNDTAQVVSMISPYGIILSDKQLNALTFTHGGWSVDKGRMKPLAIIMHCADLISTYILDKE